MNASNRPSSAQVSWPLLLAISVVITGTAALMVRNVIYTEGEIMRPIFGFLVVILLMMLGVGFFNRTRAAWLIVICGGTMILWQANQTRRWGILHEEVLGIVAYVENARRNSGSYPPDLGGYQFLHPRTRDHISYSLVEGKLHITYFLNNPGTSYWYNQDGGFGYYPD